MVALLRKRMYPNEKGVKPFDSWLSEMLRLRKKVTQPLKSGATTNATENPNNYRINQLVWINYQPFALSRGLAKII